MVSLTDQCRPEAIHAASRPMLRVDQEALTFDDVLLLPGYSEVVATDVSLQTRLTREIALNIPLVSAAMDTVTEARLAITMAQEGGIGIIHKNLTPAEQAEHVKMVHHHHHSQPTTCCPPPPPPPLPTYHLPPLFIPTYAYMVMHM